MVTLPPVDGFGDPGPELTFTDDIANVPPEYRHIGSAVMFQNDRGEGMAVVRRACIGHKII